MNDAFQGFFKGEEKKRMEDQKEGAFKINLVGSTLNAQEKEKHKVSYDLRKDLFHNFYEIEEEQKMAKQPQIN